MKLLFDIDTGNPDCKYREVAESPEQAIAQAAMKHRDNFENAKAVQKGTAQDAEQYLESLAELGRAVCELELAMRACIKATVH